MVELSYLGVALERLEEGVIALNMSLTPVAANRAGRRLLSLPDTELPADLPLTELRSIARRAYLEDDEIDALLRIPEMERSLRVRAIRLAEPEGVLLFLRDVTDEYRTQHSRKQFVANASHELKTPVASLQALAEAIQEAAGDDPVAAQRFSEQMAHEARRLGALIDDLLDLSRVEDPGSFIRTEVDLSALVNEKIRTAQAASAGRSLQIDSRVEAGLRVRGDTRQLELLIRNLLDNAVLYSRQEGTITVSLHGHSDEAILEVTDEGIGIPLHAQSRIFERFYRVDDDRAREGGGTGLGLAIVKNAAESHGGSVTVSSTLGEGSTFSIRLPLDR